MADSPGSAEDWIVDMLCTHYADQGHAAEGLTYLDSFKTRRGEEDWDFFRMRLPLMVAGGLREEAIEMAQAHPEGGTWYAAWSIAELLADAGRTEEAVATLEQQESGNSSILAWNLIDLDRVSDAISVLQRPKPGAAWQASTDGTIDAPPF